MPLVRKLLLLIPSLEYGGAARQLTLLAAGLPRERFEPHVAVLGAEGPFADAHAQRRQASLGFS